MQSTNNYETLSDSVVIGVVPYTQYSVKINAKQMSSARYWSQPSTTYVFVSAPSGT